MEVCKAFEDMRQDRIDIGIRILIESCHELGLTQEAITEKYVEIKNCIVKMQFFLYT